MASTPPAERLEKSLEKLTLSRGLLLTYRILAVNILPLLLLGGGIFYLDGYRKQLLDERYKLARIEAQITAEALAGASRERQEALLIQIGKEQKMRLRMFDAEGNLWADSFALDTPAFQFDDPAKEDWREDLAQLLDHGVDAIVGAPPIPDYIEPEAATAASWPELARAREQGISQIQLRDAPDGTPVINAAAPVGLQGSTLLTTRNAVDITNTVREARSTLVSGVFLALFLSVALSLYLARTIVLPLRSLARAAIKVRQGRERDVEVPRLPDRKDEIGLLARAVSDMTDTLRERIDAVEHFAADVAHEIKNPLTSLRSAVETMRLAKSESARERLLAVIEHDVARLDRLVTDISNASRLDAELVREEMAPLDLCALVRTVADVSSTNADKRGVRILVTLPETSLMVRGLESRLGQVLSNLIDNGVSFSPEGGALRVSAARQPDGDCRIAVEDDGPGVPPDNLHSIFERFYTERPSYEDFGQHSGLGLSISRQIVEAHRGRIWAENREDETGAVIGARFVVLLPA